MGQIFLGNTTAGITDTDGYITILGTECESNGAAWRGVTHRIIQEVFDNPLNHSDVGICKRKMLIVVDLNGDLPLFCG